MAALQHLTQDSLPVDDLAVLVASVSDNLATNVLLERIGLDQVKQLAKDLGLTNTALLDRVRDQRGSEHPPGLSIGSAGELSQFMSLVSRRELLSPGTSDRMSRWLATDTDLSMVASAFGLDPLSHVESDRGLLLRNKTGTDAGVRADVGFVDGPEGSFAYAVVANWPENGRDPRDLVLTAMRRIGEGLSDAVSGSSGFGVTR
ncbi:serine hydrolase [Streptomyces himalayensis]|uniref:Serine hydrolase n=1 Tax=Streptomyces himalayensis subsp. himalayensis TaxID=2756131 RepID=A0A7W0DMY8_9ACTN|nr:serine hydrolase [Streptomyces himalayensis]MBA2948059.1 serine hydrolase [Streptomyces himalayensis subsp. himalayensis]